MSHLSLINNEFFKYATNKIAIDSDWWKKLSPEEQKQYILQHRKTKLRPNSPIQSQIQHMLGNIPKDWKQDLKYRGVGVNSNTILLPDTLRPRLLKDTLSNSQNVAAIIAYNMNNEPEFIITRDTYRDDKFSAKKLKRDKEGKLITNEKGQYLSESLYKTKDHYSRRRNYSYETRQQDLRMSNIVDMLEDKPYKILGIGVDESRKQLQQQRHSLRSLNSHRSIETKIISKYAKPIYDYYNDKVQADIEILKKESIPSYDEVLNNKRFDSNKLNIFLSNLKEDQSKLGELQSDIRRFRDWYNLPSKESPYVADNRINSEALRFLTHLHEFKNKYQNEYRTAMRMKRNEFRKTLISKDYEDAIDILKDIDMRQIIPQVAELERMTTNLTHPETSESYKFQLDKCGSMFDDLIEKHIKGQTNV